MKGRIMSYIIIDNYTKKIKDNIILDNINLSLEKNKVYGFVGINGSGKTMLFRAVSGLISPTSGKIIVDGISIGNGNHPQNMGLLLENANLWNNLSAFENLKLLNCLSKKQVSHQKIKETIADFGLDPESKKTFKAFSLGMKQKLRIAQLFMNTPTLMIMDEPTNALDEESSDYLKTRILKAKEDGSTILIASHSSQDIHMLCDEIIYMKDGTISKREKVEHDDKNS